MCRHYEDNNSVFIGMTKPPKLIGMLDDDELSDIAMEVEEKLQELLG